jgi:hypothetical protein
MLKLRSVEREEELQRILGILEANRLANAEVTKVLADLKEQVRFVLWASPPKESVWGPLTR